MTNKELEAELLKVKAAAARAELRARNATASLRALGAISGGYCFCAPGRRDPDRDWHTPECRDARAVLAAAPDSDAQLREVMEQAAENTRLKVENQRLTLRLLVVEETLNQTQLLELLEFIVYNKRVALGGEQFGNTYYFEEAARKVKSLLDYITVGLYL